MDPELEQLKELVRQNIAISQETQRTVRAMRRGTWLSALFRILWILVLVVAGYYSYLYLEPYLTQLESIYSAAQNLQQQAQGYLNQSKTQ